MDASVAAKWATPEIIEPLANQAHRFLRAYVDGAIQVADEIRALGRRALALPADIVDPGRVRPSGGPVSRSELGRHRPE